MRRCSRSLLVLAITGAVGLLLAACGGGEDATATPAAPTPTRAPDATTAPAPTTATPARPVPPAPPTPAPTARPVPTPTPTPAAVSQAPAVASAGKRGGTLVGRSLSQPRIWDTFDATAGGSSDVHTLSPMFNNLIFLDPYGDGKTLVGDAAEGWQFSDEGKTLTFRLRRDIKFHDGAPLTSKDVAYAFDRGWKPRSTTMTFFRARFSAIQKIEAPDDFTVRVGLSEPSNIFLQAVSMSNFLLYPERLPFPERQEQWRANPIGSGPFKFKSFSTGVRLDFVRNDDYWKPGLPYLDAYNIIQMTPEQTVAAFRTGRLDTTNLDPGSIGDFVDQLVKSTGFVPIWIKSSWHGVYFSQRPPWNDPRAREAADLALQREDIIKLAYQGQGSPYWAPLMPPELGGVWGISTEVMKQRPGYRTDRKADDIARARQLLRDAGVDPARFTLNVIANSQLKVPMEAIEQSFRELGFRTRLEALDSPALLEKQRKQEFDVWFPSTAAFFLDDPMDVLFSFHHSEGSNNWSKWSDPEMDALFLRQDRVLDPAQRRVVLNQLQEKILTVRWSLGVLWRFSATGHQPWMKNYPGNLPFLFNQRFRYEQAWLDRQG